MSMKDINQEKKEEKKEKECACGSPLFFGQSECARCEHDNQI